MDRDDVKRDEPRDHTLGGDSNPRLDYLSSEPPLPLSELDSVDSGSSIMWYHRAQEFVSRACCVFFSGTQCCWPQRFPKGGGNWRAYISHAFRQMRFHKVNYLLGMLSCLLVVTTVAAMFTVMAKSPLVFVRLAELEVGEIDMSLQLNSGAQFASLNSTVVGGALSKGSAKGLWAPRLELSVSAIASMHCPFNVGDKRGIFYGPTKSPRARCNVLAKTGLECLSVACDRDEVYTKDATIIAIDSKLESDADIGRSWGYDSIPANKAVVHMALAQQLGVSVGDTIYVLTRLGESNLVGPWNDVDLGWVLYEMSQPNDSSRIRYNNAWSAVVIPLEVHGTYLVSGGKHSIDQTDAILVELSSFAESMANGLHIQSPSFWVNQTRNLKLDEYASSILVSVPPARIDFYDTDNMDKLHKDVLAWASNVLYPLGFMQFSSSLPILTGLEATEAFAIFLGFVLNIVVMILVGLSVLLIYSLLMVSVESRAFELGVLRMVGMTRSGIVKLLLVQAISYAIPAIVIGLLFGQVGVGLLALLLRLISGVPVSPLLTWDSIAITTTLAVLTPVLSSILPIWHALQNNLSNALDVNRQTVQAVEITVERSEETGFSWTILSIGGLLSLFGFGVYYLLPLALLTFNMSLLFNLFLALLLGMLMGLVVISLNLAHLLERVFIATFLIVERRAIRTLIVKNLIAHRPRNRKTSILFASAVAFILFLVVTYQTTVASVIYVQYHDKGALVRLKQFDTEDRGDGNVLGLPFEQLEAFLLRDSKVESWAWTTMSWAVMMTYYGSPGGSIPTLSNIGRSYSTGQSLYAISPQFVDSTVEGLVDLAMQKDSEPLSSMLISEQLYSRDGSASAIIGSLYMEKVGLDSLNDEFLFIHPLGQKSGSLGPVSMYQRLHPMAFASLLPSFIMSDYPAVMDQSAIVSFLSMLRILNASDTSYNGFKDLPMAELLIKMKDDDDSVSRQKLATQLRAVIDIAQRKLDRKAEVWTIDEVIGPIEIANNLLFFFFGLATVAALIVASFSLVSSVYTNIQEQKKEIGVLRAVGISRSWIRRVYVFEAMVTVIAATLLGILVGATVAYTLVLQRILFTHFPLQFVLPWSILGIVFVVSVIVSIFASLIPISWEIRKPVVWMLRSQT